MEDRPDAGEPFTKASLQWLLSYVIYIGKARHQDENSPGEQANIGGFFLARSPEACGSCGFEAIPPRSV